jgi:hypothetical protein
MDNGSKEFFPNLLDFGNLKADHVRSPRKERKTKGALKKVVFTALIGAGVLVGGRYVADKFFNNSNVGVQVEAGVGAESPKETEAVRETNKVTQESGVAFTYGEEYSVSPYNYELFPSKESFQLLKDHPDRLDGVIATVKQVGKRFKDVFGDLSNVKKFGNDNKGMHLVPYDTAMDKEVSYGYNVPIFDGTPFSEERTKEFINKYIADIVVYSDKFGDINNKLKASFGSNPVDPTTNATVYDNTALLKKAIELEFDDPNSNLLKLNDQQRSLVKVIVSGVKE